MPVVRLALVVLSVLGVLVAAGPVHAHGHPVSRVVVSVGDGELAVRANLYLESVLEQMEGSHDSVHTGNAAAVVSRERDRILQYLHEHLTVSSGRAPCVARAPRSFGVEGNFYVKVDLEYDCPKPTEKLSVTSRLFQELDESHHIEGEFHFDGRRRVYQLTNIRTAVAVDPSSFHDKPVRGSYVPILASERSAAATASLTAPATNDRRAHEQNVPGANGADREHASPASDDSRRGLGARGVWYTAALALVVGMWHVQRTLRNRRSQRRATPDDSKQALSG